MFKKNTAGFIHFPVINRTTGLGVTTGNVTASIYHDGSLFSTVTLTPGGNHLGNGFWRMEISAGGMNADSISIGIVHADSVPNMISINTFIRTTEEIYAGITSLIAGVNVTQVAGGNVTNVTNFHGSTLGLSTFDAATDFVIVKNTVAANILQVNGAPVTVGDFWGIGATVNVGNIVQANIVQVATSAISNMSDFWTPTTGLSTFDHLTDFVTVAPGGINAASLASSAVGSIVNGVFNKIVDGSISADKVMKMLLSWMAGKVDVVDTGSTRTITFYLQDNSTEVFEIVASESESQEGQRSTGGTIT